MQDKGRPPVPSDKSYLLDTLRSLKHLIDDTQNIQVAAESPNSATRQPQDNDWVDDIPVLRHAVRGPSAFADPRHDLYANAVAASVPVKRQGDVHDSAALDDMPLVITELPEQLQADWSAELDSISNGDEESLPNPAFMADRAIELIDDKLHSHVGRSLHPDLANELRQMMYVFLTNWVTRAERALRRRVADDPEEE